MKAGLVFCCFIVCIFFILFGFLLGFKHGKEQHTCPESIKTGMVQVDSVTWKKVELRETEVFRYYEIQEK